LRSTLLALCMAAVVVALVTSRRETPAKRLLSSSLH
jgi:hypothetical protein